MPGASMAAWRQRLGACLGYDAGALAPTARPQIMVVARPYSAGRSLLNLEEVVAAIRGRYGESADVSVRYMEVRGWPLGSGPLNMPIGWQVCSGAPGVLHVLSLGPPQGLSVRQQAALWSSQSIVVHVHGSVLGSWQFLPRGAVAVQLSALPIFHEHAGAFGNGLVSERLGRTGLGWDALSLPRRGSDCTDTTLCPLCRRPWTLAA